MTEKREPHNTVIEKWRSAHIERNAIILYPHISPVIVCAQFHYPRVMVLHNEGNYMYAHTIGAQMGDFDTTTVANFDPLNEPYDPDPTWRAELPDNEKIVAWFYDEHALVYGNSDGQLAIKNFTKSRLKNEASNIRSSHECKITAIGKIQAFSFSGDEFGNIVISDLVGCSELKAFELTYTPIIHIKGTKSIVVASTSDTIYVVQDWNGKGEVKTIEHAGGIEFFEVGFVAQIVIVVKGITISSYSINPDTFGTKKTFSLTISESFTHLTMEDEFASSTTFSMVAVVNKTRVISFDNDLNPLTDFVPKFPEVTGKESITSIALNSDIILVGSSNGHAAIFDFQTGDLLQPISSKTAGFPVRYSGISNHGCGMFEVNGVIQTFELKAAEKTGRPTKKNGKVRMNKDRKGCS